VLLAVPALLSAGVLPVCHAVCRTGLHGQTAGGGAKRDHTSSAADGYWLSAVLSHGLFSRCDLDESAVVHSVLDSAIDADASCWGYGGLVGDGRDDCLDAAFHARLQLVCRASVPLRRADVWAKAKPGAGHEARVWSMREHLWRGVVPRCSAAGRADE